MIRFAIFPLVIAVAALAGCGADGPPLAPQGPATTGVSVSGDLRLGVTVGD